jgi:hypothetical protein
VVEGVIRPIDERNGHVSELMRKEEELRQHRHLETARQRYSKQLGAETSIVERRIFGKLTKAQNSTGAEVWMQELSGQTKPILGELVGLNSNNDPYDLAFIEEYPEDSNPAITVQRQIRGELHIRQKGKDKTEMVEIRNNKVWEIVKGSIKNLGQDDGYKMILVDEYTNDSNQVIRREIGGQLEEKIDDFTKICKIVERAYDLDKNPIVNGIRGVIKCIRVFDSVRDFIDGCRGTGVTIYDYIDQRKRDQCFMGKLKVLDLNEGRGIELVEETKGSNGVALHRVLHELDLSLNCWFRNSAIEEGPALALRVTGKSGKIDTESSQDGFFEQVAMNSGDVKRTRMRGVLKMGWVNNRRTLLEQGMDKDGNLVARPVRGEIINPKCCSRNPV